MKSDVCSASTAELPTVDSVLKAPASSIHKSIIYKILGTTAIDFLVEGDLQRFLPGIQPSAK